MTKNKRDILNYEEALMRLAAKKPIPRPPYWVDATWDLCHDIWTAVPDARKIERLVDDVFGTQAALAAHLQCPVQLLKDTSHRGSEIEDWEDLEAVQRMDDAWLCFQFLSFLTNRDFLPPDKCPRIGVRVDQYDELMGVLKRAQATPAKWTTKVTRDLACMCQLVSKDYPGVNC